MAEPNQITKSRWQQEYDQLPEWARDVVDALKPCVGYGGGADEGILGESTKLFFKTRDQANLFVIAISGAIEFKNALSAPFPPPPQRSREKRVFNVVELVAGDGEDSECAFDQPCCFGHRVENHAVYCHNEAWPDSPRKCRRNRDDYRHEDCPGFVANPDVKAKG